ncbi:MAG: YHYH protein [Microthrixaceae bacterium]
MRLSPGLRAMAATSLGVLALVMASCSSDDSDPASSSTSSPGSTETTLVEEPLEDGGEETTTVDLADCTVDVDELPEEPRVEESTDDTYRYIDSNGMPDHSVGEFPNTGNPNALSPQEQSFRMRLDPDGTGADLGLGMFGVAVNGIVFEGEAAEFWQNDENSGWQYDALGGGIGLGFDCNTAHVQPNGKYHYHGVPKGLVDVLGVNGDEMTLIGWAADGNPMYVVYGYSEPNDAESEVVVLESSYELKTGERPGGSDVSGGTDVPGGTDGPGGNYDGTFVEDWEYVPDSGDLDECNGREGTTPDFPGTTYYYVLTETFPFVPRCYVAAPDESFELGGPGPNR